MKVKEYQCAYGNSRLCPTCLHEGPTKEPCAFCNDITGWFIVPNRGLEDSHWHIFVKGEGTFWKAWIRRVGQTSTTELYGRSAKEVKQKALERVNTQL